MRQVSCDRFAGSSYIPQPGPRAAITVPGASSTWRLAHARCRPPFGDLLATAIGYAREGMPVTDDLAQWIEEDRDVLGRPRCSGRLPQGWRALPGRRAPSSRRSSPTRWSSSQRRARARSTRPPARASPSISRASAAALRHADFEEYRALGGADLDLVQGLRGLPAAAAPGGPPRPQSLDGIDFSRQPPNGEPYYHALIQATKWAFEKRDAHLCDPDFADIPLARLLDPAICAAERQEWLNGPVRLTATAPTGSDTTFICVADSEGNAVGTVQSLYFDFARAWSIPPRAC